MHRRAGVDFARRKIESIECKSPACTGAIRPEDCGRLNGQPRGMPVAEHYQTHAAKLPR